MRIKDVEERTGLTAKAIRLYDADLWQTLLELDAWLMSADIPKMVSNDNRDKALYDQEIWEICDTIMDRE